MNITSINTNYIKALNCYPYDLEGTIENLNYALNEDDRNADAHCLLGKVYAFQMQNYAEAIFHFQEALCTNNKHIDTYYNYIWFCIEVDDFKQAKKLIDFAINIKGISKVFLKQQTASILEKKGKFEKAKKVLKVGIKLSICNSDIDCLKEDLARIKEKLKSSKKKNCKKSKKKKKKK